MGFSYEKLAKPHKILSNFEQKPFYLEKQSGLSVQKKRVIQKTVGLEKRVRGGLPYKKLKRL